MFSGPMLRRWPGMRMKGEGRAIMVTESGMGAKVVRPLSKVVSSGVLVRNSYCSAERGVVIFLGIHNYASVVDSDPGPGVDGETVGSASDGKHSGVDGAIWSQGVSSAPLGPGL